MNAPRFTDVAGSIVVLALLIAPVETADAQVVIHEVLAANRETN